VATALAIGASPTCAETDIKADLLAIEALGDEFLTTMTCGEVLTAYEQPDIDIGPLSPEQERQILIQVFAGAYASGLHLGDQNARRDEGEITRSEELCKEGPESTFLLGGTEDE
jgi:hypothetical protein